MKRAKPCLSSTRGFGILEMLVAASVLSITALLITDALIKPRQHVVQNELRGQVEDAVQSRLATLRAALVPATGNLSERMRALNSSSDLFDPVISYDIGSSANFLSTFGRSQTETVTIGSKPFKFTYSASLKKYDAGYALVDLALGSDHLSQLSLVKIAAEVEEVTPSKPPISFRNEVFIGL